MKRRLATVLTALIVLAAPLALMAITPTTAHAATDTQAATTPAYVHSAQATQNGVTFTVQWNDAPAGEATAFHVTAQGGSGSYKARMDVPTYWDHGSQESVCDPSRNQWLTYTSFTDDGSADFSFEFTASGTYHLYFYFMDPGMSITWLRADVGIDIDDPARPSVTDIVNSAVAQCKQQTDGSEYAMALWLHDWAIDQLEYDRKLNWCSAESGLTRHTGTCESYQRIYAKLLNAAGIANGRIEGNGHTWNAVKIDGEWCQMDLTWDDSTSTYGDLEQRHLYFGLSDELMAVAHSDHTGNYQKDGYEYHSTSLKNDYYVRNGKAKEWVAAYSDSIQKHLDAHETEFEIDANNPYDPPSISGIKNGIIAYQMNQMEWKTGGNKVDLTAESKVEMTSNTSWTAKYAFEAKYKEVIPRVVADGEYRVASSLDSGLALARSGSAASLAASGGAVSLEWDESRGLYRVSAGGARLVSRGCSVSFAEGGGSDSGLWRLVDAGDGAFSLVNAASGLALDVPGGRASEGAALQAYSPNGTAAQSWRLTPIGTPALADGEYL